MPSDDEYREVFGVEFYQPPDPYGLNEESIMDDSMNLFWLLIAMVPMVGISIPIACLTSGYAERHDNAFRIYEQAWKVGIIGLVLQTISMGILLVLLLV